MEQSIDIRTKAGGGGAACWRRRSNWIELERGGLDEQLRGILVANAVRVIDLFRQWDEDGSGLIDFDEFALGMRHLGLDASTDEVHRLFESFDPDQSGSIDIESSISYFATERRPPHRAPTDRPPLRCSSDLSGAAHDRCGALDGQSRRLRLCATPVQRAVGMAASVSFAAGVGGSHAATSAAGIGAAAASVKRGQPQHRSAASIVTHIPEKRWREPPIDATQEPPIEPKSPARSR